MPDGVGPLASAAAVRERCTALLKLAEGPGLPHFTVHTDRLPDTAAYVARVIRHNYPTLDIPHHARWRHFATGGTDRWAPLAARIDPAELPRTRTAFCIVSVLLDAGAGPGWRFHDAATGQTLARSEGLGVASLRAFEAGLFSDDGAPRIDAAALARIDAAALGAAFQVSPGNPLAGLEGRAALLRSLAAAVTQHPDVFMGGTLGGLFDAACAGGGTVRGPSAGGAVHGSSAGGAVRADTILSLLLQGLGGIWPSRPLGDVWRHSAVPGDSLVPFHKLSQWLAYSLIEVFEDAGIHVAGIGALTGLPEYRNGGLLLDLGVLQPRDPTLSARPLEVGDEPVVEWRALTVALLDRLAPPIRALLGRDEAALPLSRILEGGTWAAGRAIAMERRPGGGPPLTIISDGTVF